MTSYRSFCHSVQFFRPVKSIVRTDEANSMAFLQREFLPSNDTYKTKTSAGNTLHFIRGNENVTHSAQGETVFSVGIFCFEYPRRRSGKGNVYFANNKFSFRKLQIFISQTTDFHFANYRFPFRKLQIPISQTTDSHFANYRFSFRKLQISISQTTDFHFVSSHFVSQTIVSRMNFEWNLFQFTARDCLLLAKVSVLILILKLCSHFGILLDAKKLSLYFYLDWLAINLFPITKLLFLLTSNFLFSTFFGQQSNIRYRPIGKLCGVRREAKCQPKKARYR